MCTIQPGLIRDPESASAQPRGHHNKHSVRKAITVLLEYYFTGEKLLQMNSKFDLLHLTIAFWKGLCVFTSNNWIYLLQVDQPSQDSQMLDARKLTF